MKRRVFLLEDDESLSSLIKLKLERSRFDVVSFLTATEAYDVISDDPDGILLADYILPEMNCDILISKLKDIKINIPFVVMTGVHNSSLGIEMMKKGAGDFIVKNLGFIDTLPGVIERVYDNALLRNSLEQSIESIKQNELKLRIFFENIQDIFFVLNKYGKVVEISPSVEKVLGFTTHQIIGKRIKKIFVNNFVYNEIYTELSVNNSITSRNIVARHKNGDLIYLSVSCNTVLSSEGEIQIMGIAQDISNKRMSNAEVMQKVLKAEEYERKKVAEAIHDDLGPMMSVIKMYFELICNSGEDALKREKLLKKISGIIDSTIQKARAITTDLLSNVLDLHGLKTAVETFAGNVSFASGICFSINIGIAQQQVSRLMEEFLYRTSIEFINNTIKHAKAGEIYLDIYKTQRELIFQYRDNGCGFDTEILNSPDKPAGHGLLSIKNKVSMMSGYCSIISKKDSGMQVKIKFDNNLI